MGCFYRNVDTLRGLAHLICSDLVRSILAMLHKPVAASGYDGNDARLAITYKGQTTSYLQDIQASFPVALLETKNGQSSYFMYGPDGTAPLFQSGPTTGANASYGSAA